MIATFLGGPWDLHRVELPEPLAQVYEVPVANMAQYTPESVSLEWDVKIASYRLFSLPNPASPAYVEIYLYTGQRGVPMSL